MRIRGLLASLLATYVAGGSAAAMQFQQGSAKDGATFISAEGEIHTGDAQQFQRALAAVPAGKRLAGVLVDSPGGNLIEGGKLADQIHDSGLTVIVTSHSQCASACFLLLAASPHRVAGVNALVGVHSASLEGGRETTDTMAMTLVMQRIAGDYGVPPAILGKIAQTTPGRIAWLTHEDLVAMDVKIIDDAGDAPTLAPAPAPAPAPRPPALRPPMVKPSPPVVARAEYQGALFCRQGTAKLLLRVVDSADDTHRRAVFSFAPMPSGGQVSSGSFLMEGRLDLSGGSIDLRPTQWVSPQPGDFAMVGLSGRSDDGGKTFSGHAMASTSCTVFTMKRMH
jgi:hypothetical protein